MNQEINAVIDELRRRRTNESLVEAVAAELVKRFGSVHDTLLGLEWVALDHHIEDPAVKSEMTRQILERAKGPMIKNTIEELNRDSISTVPA